MNEGDIFFWSYRDDVKVGGYPYHCKSRKAIVINGRIIDTFWATASDGHVVDPERTVLDFKGNIADLRKISDWEARYYDAGDVVDMRHSNNSQAEIYVKAGACRSKSVMLKLIASMKEDARSDIRIAQHRLERFDEAEELVLAGKLDGICI